MNALARDPRRIAAAAAAALLLAAACTDRSPTAGGREKPGGPTAPPGTPVHLVAVTCNADVASRRVTCGDPAPTGGASTDLIVGGQGQFVEITTGTALYDQGTFTVPVAVRNLIRQPLGTSNATTLALDPSGVRVFLEGPPVVTAGTGSVTAVPDGTGTFTATDQPYWQYNQVLGTNALSSSRTWTFTLPTTVTGFRFRAFVSAVVPYPNGWVDITPTPLTLRPFSNLQVTGVVVNAVGLPVPGSPAITFASPDTTVATINADGIVAPLRAGTIVLTASGGGVTGAGTVTVTGTTRTWEGDVSTDWNDGNNWVGGVAPVPVDSVSIPSPAAGPSYPVLVENENIAGVTVAAGATISLTSFNLTASANVLTGTTGGINSTSGRLFLTGTAKTVQGVLPPTRVQGTYSLTGNIAVRAPLQVDAGRLTNLSYRVQVVSQ